MFSLAWSLTLFAGRQMFSLLLDPMAPLRDMPIVMNTLAESMAARLGPSGQGVYKVGDRIQRNIADSIFAAGAGFPAQSAGWGPVDGDGSGSGTGK